ncbi:hypothetical protein ACHWQZ_G001201 [Mnemiopsis leidyi]
MSKEAAKREGGSRKDEMRDGDWLCAECSSHNYNARITCYKCTLPKNQSELKLKGKSALDWECFQCKMTNFGWREECFKCHISRRESDDIKARQVGIEWFCRICNLKNFPNRDNCFKCKRPRDFCDARPGRSRSPPRGMRRSFSPGRRSPPQIGRPSPPRRQMSPPRRPMSPPRRQMSPPRRPMSPPRRPMSPPRRGRSPPRQRSRSPLNRRGPSPPRRMSPPPARDDEEWRCNLCGTLNGFRRKDCYKCCSVKPNSGPRPGPSLLGQVFGDNRNNRNSDGSWDCPDCSVKNYSFRTECFKCKAPKPNDSNRSQSSVNLNHSGSNRGLLSTPGSKPDDYYEPESPPPRMDSANNANRQQFGPDWSCKFCSVDIFPTRNDCYKCGRSRDECDSGGAEDLFNSYNQGKRSSSSAAPLIPNNPNPRFNPPQTDGYTCGCGTFNRSDEASCNWCGKPNPGQCAPPAPPVHDQPLPNTDWDCGDCNINNFRFRTTCFKCNKPKEECEVLASSRGGPGGSNERRNSPVRRGDRRERSPPRRPLLDRFSPPRGVPSRFSPPRARSRSPNMRRGFSPQRRGFSPPRRGFSPPRRGFSPPRRGFSPPRRGRSPPFRGRSPRRRSPPRPGPGKNYQPDWECKECQINNFVKRTKCFRCGKQRSEVEVQLNSHFYVIT